MMGLINILSNGYEIVKTNRSDINHIASIQQERFRKLLRFAISNSEFYRELYEGIDIENCQLQDLPAITKSNMMENYDRLVTDKRLKLIEIQNWLKDKNNEGKLYKGKFIPVLTSGSTGANALIVYSQEAIVLVQIAIHFRLGIDTKLTIHDYLKMIATQILGPRLRIAVLGVPRGNIFALANYTTLSHNLFVRRKIYSIFDPIDQIVEELNEYQPHHLMSTSNFIATLAQEQLAGRLKISFDHPLSCLAGGAEPLTENVKRLAFDAWKVNVRNIYGTAECYLMATSCKEFNRLHVMNDLCIIEIVDKDNNPIPPGQNGYKVLLTNLYNYVQPIIRYEIEDVTGYVGQKCDCGLPFPILSSIKNRTTDILYFEKQDGSYEIFHPYRLVIPLRYESELWQYQIVQTARNELTFFYVPRNDSVEIEKQLMHTIKEALDQAGLESVVTLKVKRVESLSRDAKSGKFKMVESLGAPTHLDTALQK